MTGLGNFALRARRTRGSQHARPVLQLCLGLMISIRCGVLGLALFAQHNRPGVPSRCRSCSRSRAHGLAPSAQSRHLSNTCAQDSEFFVCILWNGLPILPTWHSGFRHLTDPKTRPTIATFKDCAVPFSPLSQISVHGMIHTCCFYVRYLKSPSLLHRVQVDTAAYRLALQISCGPRRCSDVLSLLKGLICMAWEETAGG